MKYVVNDLNEITWWNDNVEEWDDTKKHIPETIGALEEAGLVDDFLKEHVILTEDGDEIVDMEDVYETLRHESDDVMDRFIGRDEESDC